MATSTVRGWRVRNRALKSLPCPIMACPATAGPAAPFARAYLSRLAETIVDNDTAMSVASILV